MKLIKLALLVFVVSSVSCYAALQLPCECPALPQNINGSILFEDGDSYFTSHHYTTCIPKTSPKGSSRTEHCP